MRRSKNSTVGCTREDGVGIRGVEGGGELDVEQIWRGKSWRQRGVEHQGSGISRRSERRVRQRRVGGGRDWRWIWRRLELKAEESWRWKRVG